MRDGFDMLLSKYTGDAVEEQRRVVAAAADRKRSAAQWDDVGLWVKRGLLGVALVGVAVGVRYAHDLGGLTATVVVDRGEPDPSLQAPPVPSKAKVQRKLAEQKAQRRSDLDEVMGGDAEGNAPATESTSR